MWKATGKPLQSIRLVRLSFHLLKPLLLSVLLTGCAISTYTVGPPPDTFTFADIRPSSVSMLTPQEGWAVGLSATSQYRTYALHYLHGTWTRVRITPNAAFSQVVMLSPTDGWAVGGAGIDHYDGVQWVQVLTDPGNDGHGYSLFELQSLAMVSPTEGWAVGENGLLQYTGGQWVNVTASLPPRPAILAPNAPYPGLYSVFMLSATEGWAVGDGGAIWHYDGRSWRPTASPDLTPYVPDLADFALYAVWMISPTEGWAVGGARSVVGTPAVIEHFANGKWTVVDNLKRTVHGTPSLRSLVMVSPTEGWAAGAQIQVEYPSSNGSGDTAPGPKDTYTSYLLHYLDGQWTEVAVPNVKTVNGLAMDAPNDGWAAADGGLLHDHNGAWSAVLK